ncbi:uncharacterized protein METZ01_LOCUS319368, partial [marine metagenome]
RPQSSVSIPMPYWLSWDTVPRRLWRCGRRGSC